jgi:probable selenium-dependent hydroxylase accessory protein YqeC
MTGLYERMGFHGGGVITLVGAGGKTTLMFRLARELSESDGPVLTTTTTKIYLPRSEESSQVIISASAGEVLARSRRALGQSRHVTAGAGYLEGQGKLTGFRPEDIGAIRDAGLFRWILVEADGAAHRSLKAPAGHEPVIPDCTRWLVILNGLDAIGRPLDEQWVFRSELYSLITGLAIGDAVTEESAVRAVLHAQGLMKGCPARAIRYVFFNKAEDHGTRRSGRKAAEMLRQEAGGSLNAVFIGSVRGDPQHVEYIKIHEETNP